MCGIFGFVNYGSSVQRKMIAILSTSRGREGTGLSWIEDRRWRTKKSPDCALKLIEENWKPDAWASPVLLGHVRAASRCLPIDGGQCKNNSHPFVRGKIVLAHNGYISNWRELAEEHIGHKSFNVDSDVAAAIINKMGIKAVGNLRGNATLWFYDMSDPSVFYLWCWHNDLAIWNDESKKQFAFASEKKFLKIAEVKETKEMITVDPDKGYLMKVDTKTGILEVIEEIKGKEFERIDVTYRHEFGHDPDIWVYDKEKGCLVRESEQKADKKKEESSGTYLNGALLPHHITHETTDKDGAKSWLSFHLAVDFKPTSTVFDLAPFHWFYRSRHFKSIPVCDLCGAFCNGEKCHVCGSKTHQEISKKFSVCTECGLPTSNLNKKSSEYSCPKCGAQNAYVEASSDVDMTTLKELRKCMACIAYWYEWETRESNIMFDDSLSTVQRHMLNVSLRDEPLRRKWAFDLEDAPDNVPDRKEETLSGRLPSELEVWDEYEKQMEDQRTKTIVNDMDAFGD